MPDAKASRTLVKSPPELWAECSDARLLGRHLGGFGEIRITRLEPEIAVAWEGERASGTVRLEPSGWGTRVELTATAPGKAHAASPVPAAPDPGEDPPPPEAPPRAEGVMARILRTLGRGRPSPEPSLPPARTPVWEAPLEAPAPTTSAAQAASEQRAALTEALDSLGRAHHRPFSRT
jgi:hypothetical protein